MTVRRARHLPDKHTDKRLDSRGQTAYSGGI